MDTQTLESLFRKALRTCKFFPKVADILEYVEHAKEAATSEAAEIAWEQVLDIRRTAYNPDMPQYLDRTLSRISERIRRAARAAGVFREHETVEALHVWTKKKFVESFLSWDEDSEALNLLPDGEIKNLLTDWAETKALPAPSVDFHALHKRGLRYAEECKVVSAWKSAADALPEFDAEARAEIETELLGYRERFSAALEKRQ